MHSNELNVVELGENSFAVRKELLSPWYYKNVPQVKDKSSNIDIDGMQFVMMPPEAIINDIDHLMNPHPMDNYGYPYDGGQHNNYAGKRPYPHQKYTSRWLFETSQQQRGAHVHSSMGCVDAETEFLTPTGWKRIADYQDGDLVYQIDPETLVGSFVLPTAYIKKPEKCLYHLKTKTLDIVTSAEHRNIIYCDCDSSFRVVSTFDMLMDEEHIARGDFKCIATFDDDGKFSSMEDFTQSKITFLSNPEGYKYCFSVESTFWLARRNGKAFVTGNTGKSLSCLWTIDYLFSIGAIKKVLIVAPKIVMRSAWLKEINSEMMWLTTCIKQGVARDRKSCAQIDIINHDGITARVDKVKKLVGKRTFYNFELLDEAYDLIVYDECTALKTVTTSRWKAFNRWFSHLHERYGTRLWMLTGTPLAQSPMDAYGLAKVVNPDSVPSSMKKWQLMTMYCVSEAAHKWEPRDDAVSLCAAALQPAIRFELSDCTDLPEHQFYYVPVEKTAKQKKLFVQISKEFIAEVNDQTRITINNGAGKQSKLLQMLSGCIYDEEHRAHETDATNKFEALVEIIDQLPDDQPIVVFTDFIHVQEWLHTKLVGYYKGKLIELINGSVSGEDRSAICNRVLAKETKVVICHTVTTALGVDFTSTNVICFFSPVLRSELYLQALDRIRRLSSVEKGFTTFLIFHIIADPIEKKIYEGLQDKSMTQNKMLQLIRDELVEEIKYFE